MNALTQRPETIFVDDLDAAVEQYTSRLDYRLDMIVPADSPVAAVLSRNGETVRLEKAAESEGASKDSWVTGRAGMMYRDLIPGRLGGKLIASHIRLMVGGEVPDYVHYHKVVFQMIYCLRGAIKVVYEDQGEPFWLRPGDCVLQPREIRHRVLWANEGSEVIELGMPAVHETWIEHEITLPTAEVKPDREFNGQRFVRHIAAEYQGPGPRDTGIRAATNGLADVQAVTIDIGRFSPWEVFPGRETIFGFIISGEIRKDLSDRSPKNIPKGEAFIEDGDNEVRYACPSTTEILLAAF